MSQILQEIVEFIFDFAVLVTVTVLPINLPFGGSFQSFMAHIWHSFAVCYPLPRWMQCVIHYHHFGIDFEPTITTTDKKHRTITRMNWCMLFVGYRCYTLDCHSIPLISFCPFPSFDLACNWSESFIPLQNRKFQNVEGRFTVFGSLKIIGTYPNGSSISISSLQTLRKQLKSAQTGLIIPIL